MSGREVDDAMEQVATDNPLDGFPRSRADQQTVTLTLTQLHLHLLGRVNHEKHHSQAINNNKHVNDAKFYQATFR